MVVDFSQKYPFFISNLTMHQAINRHNQLVQKRVIYKFVYESWTL